MPETIRGVVRRKWFTLLVNPLCSPYLPLFIKGDILSTWTWNNPLTVLNILHWACENDSRLYVPSLGLLLVLVHTSSNPSSSSLSSFAAITPGVFSGLPLFPSSLHCQRSSNSCDIVRKIDAECYWNSCVQFRWHIKFHSRKCMRSYTWSCVNYITILPFWQQSVYQRIDHCCFLRLKTYKLVDQSLSLHC